MKPDHRDEVLARIDTWSSAAARDCIEPEADFVERALASVESGETPDPSLGAHLEACPYCRALRRAHAESLAAPVPDWVGATADPAPVVPLWRRKRTLFGAAAVPVAAVAAVIMLSVAPHPPMVGPFEGQIAEVMAAGPEAAPERAVPLYAPTSTLRVVARLDEADAPAASVQAFTLDAAGHLAPVPDGFVSRKQAWVGARVEAEVARLFPDPARPTTLVLCASEVPAEALAGQTVAAVNAGSDARCVAHRIEVRR